MEKSVTKALVNMFPIFTTPVQVCIPRRIEHESSARDPQAHLALKRVQFTSYLKFIRRLRCTCHSKILTCSNQLWEYNLNLLLKQMIKECHAFQTQCAYYIMYSIQVSNSDRSLTNIGGLWRGTVSWFSVDAIKQIFSKYPVTTTSISIISHMIA